MEGNNKKLIIAIDGYSSTGKSTAAKRLAAILGYIYIDTGAMYRAITWEALQKGWIKEGKPNEEIIEKCLPEVKIEFQYDSQKGQNTIYLNGRLLEEELRSMEVSNCVSAIAELASVRNLLIARQRELGNKGGVVMDGRDIGSAIFPQADFKFFMTASPEVRAKRRYDELKAKGIEINYEEVEENVKKRDYIDANRELNPLRKMPDAIEVDNTNMGIEEGISFMLEKIREKKHGKETL
ncbi:MAG: (d)CMP kinase [Odoribacter sp.]|nr:(d)CMP kinase [Odoribacter sp.]